LRVCELHRERAVDTLTSRKDGTEYDLCVKCVEKISNVLYGTGEQRLMEANVEPDRKRPGRPPKRTQE
jgi:hypothetical protein